MAVNLKDPTGSLNLYGMRPVCKEQFSCEDILDAVEDECDEAQIELEPAGGDMDAFILQHVLGSRECAALVERTEALKYSFWCEDPTKRSYRSADTVEVVSQRLADRIWKRVKKFVPDHVDISPDDEVRWARDIEGRWEVSGVSSDMLFARYENGGHFSPHTDGNTIVDLNTRSFYTLLVYLNDCEFGGCTRLLSLNGGEEFALDEEGRLTAPESSIVKSVPVRTGNILIFYQDIVHEGSSVKKGCCKYIIRTDIMYKRVPPICTEPHDLEAYKMMKKAEVLEAEGNANEAAKLFRAAFRMSKSLADVYGM